MPGHQARPVDRPSGRHRQDRLKAPLAPESCELSFLAGEMRETPMNCTAYYPPICEFRADIGNEALRGLRGDGSASDFLTCIGTGAFVTTLPSHDLLS